MGAILYLDLVAIQPRIRQDGGRVFVSHSLVNVISAFSGPSPDRAHLVKVSSHVVGGISLRDSSLDMDRCGQIGYTQQVSTL